MQGDIPDVSIRQILEELDWDGIPPEVAKRLAEATVGALKEATIGWWDTRYSHAEFLQKAFTIGTMPVEFLASHRDDPSEEKMEAWFETKKAALRKRIESMS
jgi:hypothetical protein